MRTLWASFGNDSMLTLIAGDMIVLKALANWLNRQELKPDLLQNGETRCNVNLSKLNCILLK